MNNSSQAGLLPQGPQSAAQQQQQSKRSGPILYRPEQMRSLPEQFTQQEKEKWEQGLRSLWNQVEKNGAETTQHQEARRKLFEFSKNLTQKIHNFRLQQQQQDGAARPNSHGQQSQSQGGENSASNSNALQQPRPQPKISQKVMEHISNFPYVLPPHLTQGTSEATKWLQDAKSRYLKGLVAMENATGRIAGLDAALQKRIEEGKPLTPEEEKEFKERKEVFQKAHTDAKNFVDNFRQQQRAAAATIANANATANSNASAVAGAGANASKAANANANQQGNAAQQVNAAQQQVGVGGNANTSGQAAPPRPQMTLQQSANPALQNTQTVNAAIEAAKNQQMNGGRPSLQQNGQVTQGNQGILNVPANSNLPQHPNGQVQNIKADPGIPPQINTAVNHIQQGNQGRPLQNNSPQSAVPQSAAPQSAGPQSATATQVPRALTHQVALQTAARSYSSGQTSGTPNVMGHSHAHPSAPRETQNVMTNKMPIPKHLPERATAPPQPVAMNQSRPTYSGGPSNAGNGVMGQPVLQKAPGYSLEGDGERVLSKKKLDELVRQVTGGGGVGEGLTAEVEESILNVADNFVDQVLQAACKNAKERGSKVLEIRDIQLTLERGYNIRIPGYASDEIRTVRKIQPAPAWISKMSAVQAAKVTGDKHSD